MDSSRTPTSSEGDGGITDWHLDMAEEEADRYERQRALEEEYRRSVAEDEAGRNRGRDVWAVIGVCVILAALAITLLTARTLVRIANEMPTTVTVCDTPASSTAP